MLYAEVGRGARARACGASQLSRAPALEPTPRLATTLLVSLFRSLFHSLFHPRFHSLFHSLFHPCGCQKAEMEAMAFFLSSPVHWNAGLMLPFSSTAFGRHFSTNEMRSFFVANAA